MDWNSHSNLSTSICKDIIFKSGGQAWVWLVPLLHLGPAIPVPHSHARRGHHRWHAGRPGAGRPVAGHVGHATRCGGLATRSGGLATRFGVWTTRYRLQRFPIENARLAPFCSSRTRCKGLATRSRGLATRGGRKHRGLQVALSLHLALLCLLGIEAGRPRPAGLGNRRCAGNGSSFKFSRRATPTSCLHLLWAIWFGA